MQKLVTVSSMAFVGVLLVINAMAFRKLPAKGETVEKPDLFADLEEHLPSEWSVTFTNIDGHPAYLVETQEMETEPSVVSSGDSSSTRTTEVKIWITLHPKYTEEMLTKIAEFNSLIKEADKTTYTKEESSTGTRPFPIPQFFNDRYAILIQTPNRVPEKPDDKKMVLEVFIALAANWKVVGAEHTTDEAVRGVLREQLVGY